MFNQLTTVLFSTFYVSAILQTTLQNHIDYFMFNNVCRECKIKPLVYSYPLVMIGHPPRLGHVSGQSVGMQHSEVSQLELYLANRHTVLFMFSNLMEINKNTLEHLNNRFNLSMYFQRTYLVCRQQSKIKVKTIEHCEFMKKY